MIFEDWHTHSSLCRHAIGDLEDYVKTAIKMRLNVIGLSAHFPYEFLNGISHLKYQEYAMGVNQIENYITEAVNLKERYAGEIQVKIGFEIDFIKNQVGKHLSFLTPVIDSLDYIIGSIHNLHTKFMGLFPFDDDRCKKYYKNYAKIDDLFLEYYRTLQEMLLSEIFRFNIIGHFDLPKKFNKHPENEEQIMNVIEKVLKLAKKRKVVIELNSSGLRKPIKEQYPSEKILNLMNDLDCDIILGSDAHDPSQIAYKFDKMYYLLKKCGFRRISHFDHFEKSYIKIK